jgi:CelD/BcsL family acetyltransferase involved in cellulose biosynthesis
MDVHSVLPPSLSDGPEPNPAPGSSSVKATPPYSVEPITTDEGLSNLKDDWNRLSKTAAFPNVFMTFDWFRAWNQRFTQEDRRGRRRLNVLVLKKAGAVAGIMPIIHRTASRFGLVARKLEFVGTAADYSDFVLGNDPSGQIDAIMDFLTQTQDQWDLVDLRDLRETGNSRSLVESALSRTGLIYRILREEERCPCLLIDAPWSEMVSRRSRSTRRMMDGLHTLRKKQHRLERMSTDGLRIRIIENPHEEPGLLQKLIALESQKHVHGELSQSFIAKYPQVFQSLFDTLGPHGWLYIAVMELGERPLAWRLVFRCGKKLWDFLTAYDQTFSRLSPGMMLVSALIDYGFSHGYNEFDFLRGEESYKMRWATSFHQTYRLLIWSRRWTSRARAFIYLNLKTTVYRLFGRTN